MAYLTQKNTLFLFVMSKESTGMGGDWNNCGWCIKAYISKINEVDQVSASHILMKPPGPYS